MRATQPALQKYLIFQSLTDGKNRKVPLATTWPKKYRFEIVHRLCVVVARHVPVNIPSESGFRRAELPLGDFHPVVWRSTEVSVWRKASLPLNPELVQNRIEDFLTTRSRLYGRPSLLGKSR